MYNKLNSGFSGCLDAIKAGLDDEVESEENSLGGYLDLYTRCMEAENSMLLRRTGLMLEAEAAAKAVDKAKPNREEAAKAIRDEAEQAFRECSDQARTEIKTFHQARLNQARLALIHYVEGQLKCSRENFTTISRSIEKMKSFPVPKLEDSMFDPNDNTAASGGGDGTETMKQFTSALQAE